MSVDDLLAELESRLPGIAHPPGSDGCRDSPARVLFPDTHPW